MLKRKYYCGECGSSYMKWEGKCQECGAWDSIREEKGLDKKEEAIIYNLSDTANQESIRYSCGLNEFDRVVNIGIVEGSSTLIGGAPGIGKSNLLLEVLSGIADKSEIETLYVSGEESVEQITIRANRLKISNKVKYSITNSISALESILEEGKYKVAVIDSIQTIVQGSQFSGSIQELRLNSFNLIKLTKEKKIAIIIVSHITKDGSIAGPKLLEHMVDSVLTFEGEKGSQFRFLRANKNRFGGTEEVGIFEMEKNGLKEVKNPSSIFLDPDRKSIAGVSIYVGSTGLRSVLFEIQSLITKSFLPVPRRVVVGFDQNRLSIMIAILKVRYGMDLLNQEVYLNIAAGMKVLDSSADLAVLAALISAKSGKLLPPDIVFFGEVGLCGTVKPVPHMLRRKDAENLVFKRAVVPKLYSFDKSYKIDIIEVGNITKLKGLI